ncbi:hypothetical protein V2G26_005340 [Clonostachys chloroleuca]
MVHAQHLAIRVSNLELSTRFYLETFKAKKVLNHYCNSKHFTELLFGIKDTEYLIGFIELADGFGLELIQFVPDANPTIGVPQPQASFMHFAVAVDDVEATLSRAVAAGGDPDGNVIELNDTTWPRILASATELHPEAALQ